MYAYVILPDHIHLFLRPDSGANISTIMHSFKRNVSRDINILIHNGIDAAPGGVDNYPRLRGMHFQWQSSFHDHIIRGQRDFNTHIEYIRHNPLKHAVAQPGADYPYVWTHSDDAFA